MCSHILFYFWVVVDLVEVICSSNCSVASPVSGGAVPSRPVMSRSAAPAKSPAAVGMPPLLLLLALLVSRFSEGVGGLPQPLPRVFLSFDGKRIKDECLLLFNESASPPRVYLQAPRGAFISRVHSSWIH